MTQEEGQLIVLPREHMSVLGYMRYRQNTPPPPSVCRRKNAEDSTKYRQKGNDLYKIKNHDKMLHEKIWRTYTQSIALAPNNSEELAYGYGNRSALLFHLEKFKECIKDCDRALAITQFDLMKAKLLTRKAECLFLLNKSSTGKVCNEAMQFFKNVKLDDKIAKIYVDKLNDISSACNIIKSKEKCHQKQERKKYFNELSNFPRSEEVACASKSVAINYSKEWGRHIVATEDIRPGEILALEKNYYTFICNGGMYLYCSNCTKYAWSSIPCEHCVYDVYCSESCRSKAWKKYHQWECPVYPFIWDIDKDINVIPFAMRFILIAINEIGGIDEMKKLLLELDRYKDPRTKGFSEGIFQSNSIRSIYSLSKHSVADDPSTELSLTEQSCIGIELLARHTMYFGQKMDGSTSTIYKNKDVLFLAALMLHTHYITHNNAEHHSIGGMVNGEPSCYAITLRAFGSLINHSCDPNIHLSMGENNITFAFALKPIKKGTQLVFSYIGRNFLDKSKKERATFLEHVYKIKCQCIPCTQNWSSICLPTIMTICEVSPELQETFYKILRKMSKLRKVKTFKDIVYSPKMMRDITFFLESMAKKITIYTADCEEYMEYVDKILHDVFGKYETKFSQYTCIPNITPKYRRYPNFYVRIYFTKDKR